MARKASRRGWAFRFIVPAFMALVSATAVEGATLQTIRIREATSFTTIVFDFDGPIRCGDLTVEKEGKAVVPFRNATTVLPRHIVCDTADRVDAIDLDNVGGHLKVQLKFSFPYVKIDSATLAIPQQLVVVVRETDEQGMGGAASQSPPLEPAEAPFGGQSEGRGPVEEDEQPGAAALNSEEGPPPGARESEARRPGAPQPDAQKPNGQEPDSQETETVAVSDSETPAAFPPSLAVKEEAGAASPPSGAGDSWLIPAAYWIVFAGAFAGVLGAARFIGKRKRKALRSAGAIKPVEEKPHADTGMKALDDQIMQEFAKLDEL